MAIDVAPINNGGGNIHEANDNYLPCVEKETDSSDKLKVIYESTQPHHNIDDVNRPAALTERCCEEEITPLLLNDDDGKKTTCESNNKGWYNINMFCLAPSLPGEQPLIVFVGIHI